MAKSANLNIRIDPITKKQAEYLFSKFGITITDAVNMFLNQSIIYGGLPFELRLDTPNAQTLAAMKESDDIIKDKVTSKVQSVNDFFQEMEDE